jgi:hypothetical protein
MHGRPGGRRLGRFVTAGCDRQDRMLSWHQRLNAGRRRPPTPPWPTSRLAREVGAGDSRQGSKPAGSACGPGRSHTRAARAVSIPAVAPRRLDRPHRVRRRPCRAIFMRRGYRPLAVPPNRDRQPGRRVRRPDGGQYDEPCGPDSARRWCHMPGARKSHLQKPAPCRISALHNRPKVRPAHWAGARGCPRIQRWITRPF